MEETLLTADIPRDVLASMAQSMLPMLVPPDHAAEVAVLAQTILAANAISVVIDGKTVVRLTLSPKR